MSPVTVEVYSNCRGGWEIAFPDQRARITCETFDEARRVAYLSVARRRPCELVVRGAHRRLLHREFIDGDEDTGARPPIWAT
jgi:hypothetical protein